MLYTPICIDAEAEASVQLVLVWLHHPLAAHGCDLAARQLVAIAC